MITRTSFSSWDGDPTVLLYYADGRILGFLHNGNRWVEANAADIATKAGCMSDAEFSRRWLNAYLTTPAPS
jgi:hypothetical protein